MNIFDVETLKEDSFFTDKLFIDKTFLLLDTSLPLSNAILKQLKKWSIVRVMSEGVPALPEYKEEEEEEEEENYSDFDLFLKQADQIKDFSDEDRLEYTKKLYSEFLTYITKVYTRFSTHKVFDLEDIILKIKELCNFIKENSKYILLIMHDADVPSRSYLIDHAMRSAVLSIAIGIQLRMPFQKLQELAITAILHEIGMIRLPPQLYLTNQPLRPNDRKQLMTHPLLSYQILKDANFPLSVQLGVLEHHERENGSGYPRHLNGEQISLYGKIISVACVYDAIVGHRTYKSAKSSHQAILELLKNESHQYDPTVIKALLFTLSLYPIGTPVFLSNGKVAIVVDANPLNFKNPIVQILGETDENNKSITVQIDDKAYKINRILSKIETKEILEAMKTM